MAGMTLCRHCSAVAGLRERLRLGWGLRTRIHGQQTDLQRDLIRKECIPGYKKVDRAHRRIVFMHVPVGGGCSRAHVLDPLVAAFTVHRRRATDLPIHSGWGVAPLVVVVFVVVVMVATSDAFE